MKTTKKINEIAKEYYEIDENGKLKPVRLVGQFQKDKAINKGFVKLWTNIKNSRTQIKAFDIELYFYLIYRSDNRNRGIINMKNLAKIYGTTYQKISRHLKKFAESNLIKIDRSGHYIINPNYIFKGNAEERGELIDKYREFELEWK